MGRQHERFLLDDGVVAAAVLPFLARAAADLDFAVGRVGHVSRAEECVELLGEEHPAP